MNKWLLFKILKILKILLIFFVFFQILIAIIQEKTELNQIKPDLAHVFTDCFQEITDSVDNFSGLFTLRVYFSFIQEKTELESLYKTPESPSIHVCCIDETV